MASLVSTGSACAVSSVKAAASLGRLSRLQNGSSSSSSSPSSSSSSSSSPIKMMAGGKLTGRSAVRRAGFAAVRAQAAESNISTAPQSPINPGIRKEEPKLHHISEDKKHTYLYSRLGGECQAWLDNLLSKYGVVAADLYTKISWDNLKAVWHKRFQVEPPKIKAMDKLLTFEQGTMPSVDRIAEYQCLTSVPDIQMGFKVVKHYFIMRSCPTLGNALTHVEDTLTTTAELFDKAAQIIVTNKEAKNVNRSSAKGPSRDQHRPKVAVVTAATPTGPSSEAVSANERDRLAQPPGMVAALAKAENAARRRQTPHLSAGPAQQLQPHGPTTVAPNMRTSYARDSNVVCGARTRDFDIILGMPGLASVDHTVNFHRRTLTVRDAFSVEVSCTIPLPHPSIRCQVVTAKSFWATCAYEQPDEIGLCFLWTVAVADSSPTNLSSDPRVVRLLDEFTDIFESPTGVVPDRPISHEITLEAGAVPPKGCIYRMSEEELTVLRTQLDDLLDKGWIRPSSSPYGVPVLFVRKKNKDLRLCIDYRKLNVQTVKNAGPLPRIDDLLERLGGVKYFSKLDLKSGYHQISIRSNDHYKSAFKTRYGHFEWVVMPCGLTNAPTTFQAAMTNEFRAMLDRFVLVYLDNILVHNASGYGIGVVLEQHDSVDEHPVEYFSKKVPVMHSIDDARKKELLAFVHTLKRWRHFLLGRSQFRWVMNNNPLVFYKTQDTVNSTIDQFDFFPDHIPGKSNRFADALSRRPDHCTAVYSTFEIDDNLWDSFTRGYQVDPEFRDKYANCSSPNLAPCHYRIQEGYLLVHTRGKDLLCVPSDSHLRTRLLGEFHDAPATGHFGVNRTIRRLCERFWWPGLLGDVTRYCESCEVCRRCKSRNHRPYGELRPLPIPLRWREAIAMNITGPFPKHKTGVDGILTVVDRLTKFVMFLPCRYHAKAPELAKVLYASWIRTKGYPKEILCNRDTRFMSDFWLALIKRWGSSLKPSLARHPQTDGQTERAHQTAQIFLRTLIRPDQKDWVERLPDVELAYNSSIHPTIGMSPFKYEHGSPVTSPLDTIILRAADSDDHPLFLRQMQELLVKARDQMAKTQQRMSQHANRQLCLIRPPFGQVPVLEHGQDFTLFESRAILRYILSSVGEKGKTLLGTTLREQAKVDQWLQVEATSYDRTCGTILYEKHINPNFFKKPTDFARLEEEKSKLSALLDVYEKVLVKQEYLAGNCFTVADLSHIPHTQAMFAIGFEDVYNSRPHLREWWARVSQREACQKVSSFFVPKSRSP
ncbi:hypothetical protein CBR_g49663 [Chara braunii]|uniref:glutathione transferase n=1 Tax=Chara braunii TaxID=69332 RepID=A0A388M5R4_CHABU|nr:hypothetical protein CBR_g49663 [Chara braunii]|eukprot:GBG89812.1 hypothetical protein CBR_g49663 [Chara braunii]